jgi:hypothetical protein
MKMAAMKLGNTPRPTAWSPPLASFPPLALILATSSMWRPTEVEAVYRETPRSKGVANQARKPLGQSDWAGHPRPVFLPAAHLHILDLAPLICVILRSSSPRSR